MNKDLIAIFEYLEREKGIKRQIVIDAIEESLCAAARKSITGASNVTVKINSKTGDIEVFCEKEIVDEVEVVAQEILLEDARELDPDCELGQFIDVIVTPKDFGRIAAQKARQVISKKLRSDERDVIYEEYRHRINDLVSGTVKRFAHGSNLIIELAKIEAVMPTRHYPKTERYNIGDKVLAVLLEVVDTENGGAEVILSRSHPEFVKQLMIQEVPEVNDGTVVIDKIVRDPGYRTKLTVRSSDPKVDPVGACIGMRGIRKINVSDSDNTISIVVEDDDFAAVIGKKGMNARLNSQLIGYELEVQRLGDYHRTTELQRNELAASDDPELDKPLTPIDGVNSLIFEHLLETFGTRRSLLLATQEELSKIPGINAEKADDILEKIRKQRT